jgi:cellulose biosynthesis protein BcsQ
MPPPTSSAVCVAVTNTRLGSAKRGIAVELATRVARASGSFVCLVGADPTDRDVERRLPQLLVGEDRYTRTSVGKGTHTLDVTALPNRRLYVVELSDRTGVEYVLPELRARFDYVVVDAPSRVSTGGIGISRVLLQYVDALIVASRLTAEELALTRLYVDALDAMVGARHVDVGVVSTGERENAGLDDKQLERRVRALPLLGALPQLWGRTTSRATTELDELSGAFAPIVDWVIARRPARAETSPAPTETSTTPETAPNRTAKARYEESAP